MGGNGMQRRDLKSKWQMSEKRRRHCYSTYKYCSGWVHHRLQKHKHCQHASSVKANSRNSCTATAPHTDLLHFISLQAHCRFERGVQYLFWSTQKQGQWTVKQHSENPMRTHKNKHTARTVGGMHKGESTEMCWLHHKPFWFTVQEAKFLKKYVIFSA